MSINWHLDVDPRPAILVLPPVAGSLDEAHAAIELWEFYKRRRLDSAQRLIVEVMMATRDDGTWAAQTTGREMPRQNGKGDEVEVVELWGLTQRAERILHTVHDAVLLATETQSRLLSTIDSHPDLRAKKARAWRGTGQQMVEMRNGGIIWYRTRTGGGARGVDEVDRIVVDEAQHAEEEHLAAITPTQLASANPQLNALGTAGIAGRSLWWRRVRKRALTAAPGNFGYVGHTAEDVKLDGDQVIGCTVNVHDRTLWRRANPAFAAGRVPEGFFEEQLQVLGEALFAREHLGVWDTEAAVDAALTAEMWAACLEPGREAYGAVRYALDVSPDGRSAAVAASDGVLVEIVKAERGLSWVVPACVQQIDELGDGLLIDPAGPAGALVQELRNADVPVQELSVREGVQACGEFLTAVAERTLRHIGQPELDAAVANADRRDVGDGGWMWSRKRSAIDISPLVAATFAFWAGRARNGDPTASVY